MGIGRYFGSPTDKENKTQKERDFSEIRWHNCQCSCSSQMPIQDDLNDYHQFLSLYKVWWSNNSSELTIYDTESRRKEVKALPTTLIEDGSACITQLPNGELFCYGSGDSGIALIIDRNYGVRALPPGTPCYFSSALYFDNNIYCFGGNYGLVSLSLSRKFDLKKNLWFNLTLLPEADDRSHSVIFNGNILISGFRCKNLWLYSIEIDSFSIIPYDFKQYADKLLINIDRLYLIEFGGDGSIYESEDECHWKLISTSKNAFASDQTYCLYNKGKIYISTWAYYYEFDLKKKVLLNLKS